MKLILKTYLLLFFAVAVSHSQNSNNSIVQEYGQLRVDGNTIVNQNAEPIVLRGMSLFWSQWMGNYYNEECVKWLKDDWKCTVIRAAMGVEEGGYLSNPFSEYEKVARVIDACIEEGIYVIVDWHDHHAHENEQAAIAFFTQIASQYGDKPNIIYEIYNEPLQISWSDEVKPYSERVITEIRKIDSNNIILVGSPTWAQDVDIAANDPIEFENIAYSLHFYAATHKQSLRFKAQTALNRGAALFVSEFGTCESNGSGFLDYTETNNWIDFLEKNNISWVNWSIADKDETSAALLPGANSNGGWIESEISESGMFIRDKIRGLNTPTKVKLNEPDQKINSIQNYPNPFNNSTKLKFVLEKPDRIKLDVYNLLGEYVYHIFDRRFERGEYIYDLELSDLPSGMYLLSYESEESNEIIKIQLMK